MNAGRGLDFMLLAFRAIAVAGPTLQRAIKAGIIRCLNLTSLSSNIPTMLPWAKSDRFDLKVALLPLQLFAASPLDRVLPSRHWLPEGPADQDPPFSAPKDSQGTKIAGYGLYMLVKI